MLLCDNKPIDFSSNSIRTKWVKSRMDEIKKLKFPLRFNLPKDHMAEIGVYHRQSETVRKTFEKAQGIGVMLRNNYKTKEGLLENWTYYTTSKIDDKGRTIYGPRRHRLTSVNIFNERDIELLFYLIVISGHCEALEGVNGQNPAVRRTYMILDDKEREARKLGDKRREEMKVQAALYDPDTLDDTNLRILAKSYYLANVDQETEMDVLRDEIYRIVTKSNDKGAIRKFIERANIDDYTKTQALIQDAVDLRVIFTKGEPDGKKAWRFLNPDGSEGAILVDLLPSERAKKALVNKLISSKKLYETLTREVEARIEDKEED